MDEDKLNVVVAELADKGWCVTPDFLGPEVVAGLRSECLVRHANGGFHRAGVGSGRAEVLAEVRGDAILWLEADDPSLGTQPYLKAAEAFRLRANRALFLGLNELESHFAVYPSGAFYKKHLDRFRDDDRRTLTMIVYLNEPWAESDGGQLRFWPDPSGEGEYIDFKPDGGTLVAFLSDQYWHEVLPARRQRLALTGWFKRR
jgi:SM-20-related protein